MARKHQRTPIILLTAASMVAVVAGGCMLAGHRGLVSAEVAACRQLSQRGASAMDRGDWRAAESLFAQAIKSYPDDPNARRHYAEVLWRRGAQQEALTHAQEALRLAPDDAAIAVQVGEMNLTMGRLDEARRLAHEAIDTQPKTAAAWALRARVEQREGRLSDALTDYHRALEYAPHDRALLVEAAEIYRTQGRPQRALAMLALVRESYGNEELPPRVLYLEGLALAELRRHSDAIDSFAAAIERGGPRAELLARLADAQLRSGRTDQAHRTVQQALAIEPANTVARAVWQELEGQRTASLPQH
jgi:tetratricopeptide (TPR) repeat protein